MKNFALLLVLFVGINANAQLVSNSTQLQSAISAAGAGTTITLANGVWNNTVISINKTGTASNPITIKAQNVGQVFLEGKPQISLGGAYIVFEGFVFQNPANLISTVSGSKTIIEPIIEFRDASNNVCNNCKVTNIKMNSFNGTAAQSTDTFKWIIIYGQYNEISHSSFIGKYGVGSIINDNRDSETANYTKIHHNYFADRTPLLDPNTSDPLNDQDAIRIGNSATSLTDSFTEVYNNFFHNWSGEIEVISNKSGNNKYYNNTFKNYVGALTLRHGNSCEVFGNYFIANNTPFSGGVRVMGENHKIYNNYMEGINSRKPNGSLSSGTGGINIANGRSDGVLNGYLPVKNVTIVNNTLVNCDYGIRVGTTFDSSTQNVAPDNVIIGNNLIYENTTKAIQVTTQLTGAASKYENNIKQSGSWDSFGTIMATGNTNVTSGLLASGTHFYRLPLGSPAIGAGIGAYSFLTADILGSSRATTGFDAGAEEYGGMGTNVPYTVADVAVKVGFLSNPDPYISLSDNTLAFNKTANSASFSVSSNVTWGITANASWVTVSPTNGSHGETITINVLENTTGADRTAAVVVMQNGGGLGSSLTVNQSSGIFNPNNAVKITGLTVTGVGTQSGGINIPENTLDGITPDTASTSTRWSGESTTGTAYLTYNLQCLKTVTSVKIYFHKGSTRSSTFKIATSTDGINFVDATTVLTSSGTTAGFENFTLATNPNVQFVRIYGYGNSEGSGWNSYEEVEIHGDNNCAVLSVEAAVLKERKLKLYPVPTNEVLTISLLTDALKTIEVFDVMGKLLLRKYVNSNIEKIDVSAFSKGVYLIKADGLIGRFIVN